MFKSKNLLFIIISLSIVTIFVAACGGQTPKTDITEIAWQWASLVETEPASQSVVPNPENYTLTLMSDGTLSIKADCNMVSGGYTLNGDSLTIELGPSTMAFCGEQSLDLLYLEMLDQVEGFTVENNQLLLSVGGNSGQMTFNKQ